MMSRSRQAQPCERARAGKLSPPVENGSRVSVGDSRLIDWSFCYCFARLQQQNGGLRECMSADNRHLPAPSPMAPLHHTPYHCQIPSHSLQTAFAFAFVSAVDHSGRLLVLREITSLVALQALPVPFLILVDITARREPPCVCTCNVMSIAVALAMLPVSSLPFVPSVSRRQSLPLCPSLSFHHSDSIAHSAQRLAHIA